LNFFLSSQITVCACSDEKACALVSSCAIYQFSAFKKQTAEKFTELTPQKDEALHLLTIKLRIYLYPIGDAKK
jgi:hypothetical protein